jgi:hypothetical protein
MNQKFAQSCRCAATGVATVSILALIVAMAISVFSGVAYAGEKTLEFQLITKWIDAQTLDAPNVENQVISQSKAFGVAVFKDGRLGTKDFIVGIDNNKGTGTAFGYSTYTFEEGSITARFAGTIGPQGRHGEYKILSGTGAYAGATGTGTYDSIPNPFKNTGLFNVRLQVTTP